MKKLIFAALFLVSVNAYAGMWILTRQDFVGGYWMCTYQLQGTNYQQTIASNSYCQGYIYN